MLNEAALHRVLEKYFKSPRGVLTFHDIKIGAFHVGQVSVHGLDAAMHLKECLLPAFEAQKRELAMLTGQRCTLSLPVATPGRLLSVEIHDYLADMERLNRKADTIATTRRTLFLLKLSTGDINVMSIDHRHIHRLWELLRWIPKGVTAKPGLEELTYDRAIELGKDENKQPLSPTTMEKHKRLLTTFFNVLVAARAIEGSPMASFRKPTDDLISDPKKSARFYTEEDMGRLFAPEVFLPWAITPHRYWGPILAAFTGARANEICQLKVADIAQENGIWFIHIRKTRDADLAGNANAKVQTRQSLKGRSCIRQIPIARQLLEAGLLDYLEDLKEHGHTRVFPHLSAGVNRTTGETKARYSQLLVRDYGLYAKAQGFPPGVGLHAFRHTFASALYGAEIEQTDIALLTGHAPRADLQVPVLSAHYLHNKEEVEMKAKVKAMERFKPKIVLPVYERGKFSEQLSRDATRKNKFYP